MEIERQSDDLQKQKRQKPAASPQAEARPGSGLASALGNARVQRLLRSAHIQREGGGGVDDNVARAIESKRGSGQALDESARKDLEPALGASFGDVRVHTDGEADQLNHSV